MFTKKNPKTDLIKVTSIQIKHAQAVNIITGKNMTHVDLQLHKKCYTTTNIYPFFNIILDYYYVSQLSIEVDVSAYCQQTC